MDLLNGPRLYGSWVTGRQEHPLSAAGESVFSALRGFYTIVPLSKAMQKLTRMQYYWLEEIHATTWEQRNTRSLSTVYYGTTLILTPWILMYAYRLPASSLMAIGQFVIISSGVAYGLRFIGRSMDAEYKVFIGAWRKAHSGKADELLAVKQYDYDQTNAPVDFVAKKNDKLWYLAPTGGDSSGLSRGLAMAAVHAFGRHMLYPGSIALINWGLSATIREQRKQLVKKGGKRVRLETTEGKHVDSIYLKGEGDNAKQLVICCEGNAGFYELGVVQTPYARGYSVLGWNQPGFAESDGTPFPEQVLASADAVMQYAIQVLGFQQKDIVLYGWSIGGFPASWLAANYPDVRALILDATFDDVLPLAEARMPKLISGVVGTAVKRHFNLDIQQQVAKFQGPLKLIRRLQEEIIVTDESAGEKERRASNRINTLLKKVLHQRHPNVIKHREADVDRWLELSPIERVTAVGGQATAVKELWRHCEETLVDWDGTHVMPLPPIMFELPAFVGRRLGY